jgi:nucleoid-associated protein YgaU
MRSAEPTDANNATSAESLGELARRYRREKAAREAAQGEKVLMPGPFHLDVAQPSLAAVAPSSGLVSPGSPAAKMSKPKFLTPQRKRDPFSRLLKLPAAPLRRATPPMIIATPEVLPEFTAPVARTPRSSPNLAAPTATVPQSKARQVLSAPAAPVKVDGPLPASPLTVSRNLPKPLDAYDGKVAVHAGDSLWNLSRRYFGTGLRWRDWLASNPVLRDPRLLRPGMRLMVPRAQATLPARTFVVRAGDSLWRLAASEYGNGALWSCLLRANPRLRDPAVIFPGRLLLLPATCTASPLQSAASNH